MPVSKSPEEQKREEQRMQDVLILLEHLINNEETTIKLMIECLYDVGAVNFINRKFSNSAVNQLLKAGASMSKPVFKIYGLYWFKKNCPQLIVNWLRRKVAFPAPAPARLKEPAATEEQAQTAPEIDAAPPPKSPEPAAKPTFQDVTSAQNSLEAADALKVTPITTLEEPNPQPALNATLVEPPSEQLSQQPSTDIAQTSGQPLEPERISEHELNNIPNFSASGTIESADNPELEFFQATSNLGMTSLLTPTTPTTGQSSEAPPDSLEVAADQQVREISRLQSQVKLITGILITTLIASGAVILHLSIDPLSSWQTEPSSPLMIPASSRSGN